MPDQTGAAGASSDAHPLTDDVVAAAWTALAIAATAFHLYQSGTLPGWLMFVDTLAILATVRYVFGKGPLSTAARILRRFKE